MTDVYWLFARLLSKICLSSPLPYIYIQYFSHQSLSKIGLLLEKTPGGGHESLASHWVGWRGGRGKGRGDAMRENERGDRSHRGSRRVRGWGDAIGEGEGGGWLEFEKPASYSLPIGYYYSLKLSSHTTQQTHTHNVKKHKKLENKKKRNISIY